MNVQPSKIVTCFIVKETHISRAGYKFTTGKFSVFFPTDYLCLFFDFTNFSFVVCIFALF